MLFLYLVFNIWYQRSRSWGFAATSETPWNLFYKKISKMFQKEPLGGYLIYGSRYAELKFYLLRPYNFRDIACVIYDFGIILNLFIAKFFAIIFFLMFQTLNPIDYSYTLSRYL
jgi:hypothetical protein